MAKKVVKKLVKKTYAGQIMTSKPNSDDNNSIKNTTNFAKQSMVPVEKNTNWKKLTTVDPKTGKAMFINKLGVNINKKPEGTLTESGNYIDSRPVDSKITEPTMTPRPLIKKGGAIMAKKKMGGTTKAKKK